MTVYNINFSLGWASSGIEYAQRYRAELLRGQVPLKFIYTDFIQSENIQTLSSALDFRDDEIIWLYQYFTDIKTAPTTWTLEQLIQQMGSDPLTVERDGRIVRLHFSGQMFVTCYLKDKDQSFVDRAEFVSEGMLIRKDFYSFTRILSEYYAPFDNRAKLYMREYFNSDQTVAYREMMDGEQSIFQMDDAYLYGKEELMAYFMQKLNLMGDDTVILDRATAIGQAVIQHKGGSKLGVVIHAEHYSREATNDNYILWNNYYEYQFAQLQAVDFFITATDAQNKRLTEQMMNYKGESPVIYTIPVGSLHGLQFPVQPRRLYSVMTASRLAPEKHIDWLIHAVVLAKQELQELTFDIYGEGGEKQQLLDLITFYNAGHYIQLKGHADLRTIYPNYELFLSASTSEGFGLTLMEAAGSGLGLIGFDVDYGNPTFMEEQYRIKMDTNKDDADQIAAQLAHKITAFFQSDLTARHNKAYDRAEPYLFHHVQQRWIKMLEAVHHD